MAEYPEKPKRKTERKGWQWLLIQVLSVSAAVLLVLFLCMILGTRLPGAT